MRQEYYDKINSMQSTWTAGPNKRWEMFTAESLKSVIGTFINTPNSDKPRVKDITPIENLPESFDSRDAWPGCESLRDIRD
jgi:cathepsin B